MKLISKKKVTFVFALVGLMGSPLVLADKVVINNNTGEQAAQPQAPCTGDMNSATDPRVPPAGTYTTRNGDGSSNTVYTTGDKKPYYLDNPCSNNNATPPILPQVNLNPPNVKQ